MGLGMVFWMFLLFSPLAWVGQAKADDTENYGTVIGIVSRTPSACCPQLDPSSLPRQPHNSKTNQLFLQDLGTTYSCVGVMKNGKVEILVNDQGTLSLSLSLSPTLAPPSLQHHVLTCLLPTGNRITPSYVAFTEEERLVGDAAKNQAAGNPSNTIFDIKYVAFFDSARLGMVQNFS